MATDTIVHRLIQNSERFPDRDALVRKVNGTWTPISWKGYADQVGKLARSFMALGYEPGQTVCVLSNNRAEWVLADVAAMAGGGVAVGIYPTLNAEEVAYIATHAESPIVVVENASQLDKLTAQKPNMPHLRWAILLDGAVPDTSRQWAMTWDELMTKADATPASAYQARLDGLQSDKLATLIYTSGTTGVPKGVMLSHSNLVWTADSLLKCLPEADRFKGMSYLPLSHIAEQMLSIHCAISRGITVWFAESMEKLKDNLPDCKPTVFFGVPRVYEKFEAKLQSRFQEATGVKKVLLEQARATAMEVSLIKEKGEKPGLLLSARYALAQKLVLSKLKAALGLDEALELVSGAAPIGRSTLDFFRSIDLPILEVYGQSEGSGPTTLNTVSAWRMGTVGRVIPGVKIRLAEDGEIQVHGGNVFMGYYKNPEATAETLQDGWLLSGDIGEVDADGYLRITDRKKELLKTSGGKYISPQAIEKKLKAIPEVSQAVVIGDSRKFCSALLTLEPDACMRWATEHGLGGTDPVAVLKTLSENPDFRAYLQKKVDEVNQTLAQFETIKKFHILAADFSQEAGEMTPTMKMKRKVINQRYSSQIESMYA